MSEITTFGHLPSKAIKKFVRGTFIGGKVCELITFNYSLRRNTYKLSKKLLNFPNLLDPFYLVKSEIFKKSELF
jgi:hypothetical protein